MMKKRGGQKGNQNAVGQRVEYMAARYFGQRWRTDEPQGKELADWLKASGMTQKQFIKQWMRASEGYRSTILRQQQGEASCE